MTLALLGYNYNYYLFISAILVWRISYVVSLLLALYLVPSYLTAVFKRSMLIFLILSLEVITRGAVTSLTSLSLHAAMLEVYFVRIKTELKCGNLKFLANGIRRR